MTKEEAIEILKDWDLCQYTPSKEAAEAVISALDPLDIITALRGPTREMVERMRGEWIDLRECHKDVPKRQCSHCGKVLIGLETPFCEACGAPMTDEAVDMMLERWKEALDNERNNG